MFYCAGAGLAGVWLEFVTVGEGGEEKVNGEVDRAGQPEGEELDEHDDDGFD